MYYNLNSVILFFGETTLYSAKVTKAQNWHTLNITICKLRGLSFTKIYRDVLNCLLMKNITKQISV